MLLDANFTDKDNRTTTYEIVVKPPENQEDHMHYVAFSRVRNRFGLQILDDVNEDAVHISPKVTEQMEYLKDKAMLELCFTPVYALPHDSFKIIFHNTRSLHKHVEDLRANHLISQSQILAIAETRLAAHDSNEPYSMENYTMFRNDQEQVQGTRPPHGLLIYTHNDICVSETDSFTSPEFEFVFQKVMFNNMSVQLVFLYLNMQNEDKTPQNSSFSFQG